ncbi:hypothetical protein [Candidatus Nanohalobium constans]|uniref:Uncharacterized protein n=1 Tax=Candidatus Nanohalobium constans TaxID=2565781 RepID=A0A5Q0UGW6_9ARCH|nr:hypothetical protein [Candidatus Nanohalobium constans]QGA80450.1 hypothetical protein LC1Nh_0553 [Candidatus Nanohalobium constans]
MVSSSEKKIRSTGYTWVPEDEVSIGLSDAETVEETGEESYSLEQIVDLHTQTNYSDGRQPVIDVVVEAYEEGVYMKGVSDHVNVGEEPKEYSSAFYNKHDVIGDNAESDISVSEVFSDRYDEAITEVVEDGEIPSSKDDAGIVLWENADKEKVREDMEILREVEGDYSIRELRETCALNYGMIIFNAAETDFNPENGRTRIKEQDIDNYVENICEFLENSESENAPINHLNQAVHDVYIEDQFRYVKKDEPFEELTTDQKKEVWKKYREKLIAVAEKLAPAVQEYEVTVSGAHPALPERSSELMKVFQKPKAENEIREFIEHSSIDNQAVEKVSEPVENKFEEFVELAVTDEEMNSLYPEEALLEFWQPFIDAAKNAENYIPEIGGKHAERYPPSILWENLDTFIPGSDQHRPGEGPERLQVIADFKLPGKMQTPIDHTPNKKKPD